MLTAVVVITIISPRQYVSFSEWSQSLVAGVHVFLTWFLGSDDLLDHCRDHVSQFVFGAGDAPAVTLVTRLLFTAVLVDHLFNAEDTHTEASLRDTVLQ